MIELSVTVMRVPLWPSGWPMASAPPHWFAFSKGIPRSRRQAIDWLAKASLIYTASIWSMLTPVRASSFWTAGIGPMPMMVGSTPAIAPPLYLSV